MRLLLVLLLVAAAPVAAQASHETLVSAHLSLSAPPTADSAAATDAASGDDLDAAPAFYVTGRGVRLRALPEDGADVVATLQTRDGVRMLDRVYGGDDPAGWWFVAKGDVRGYVRAEELSNVWIRVDKSERMVYVYRGSELVRELPADVSMSEEDKVRRSRLGESEHYRIPEGTFFVTRLNDASSYYRAFVLSYPNPEHARRGLEAGYISRADYEAIVAADAAAVEPPMGTALGGLIELHGHGSGRQRAWTRGCVALRNVHMDQLWDVVEVGTPVIIER